MSTVKKFDFVQSSMYDLNTYSGRFNHFKKMTNPANFFIPKSELIKSREYIKQMKEKYDAGGKISKSENLKLWECKYICDGSFHPETGEIIPKLFRISSFLPANAPIALGLMCLPTTRFNLIFFNLLNQSYNAAMNYFTASKSEDNSKDLLISFSLAVSVSIGSALLFKRILKNPGNSLLKISIQRLFPTCFAGFMNLTLMRINYYTKGLDITDKQGNKVGSSSRVGLKALVEGGASRFLLSSPFLLLFAIEKNISKISIPPKIKITFDFLACMALLNFGLPFSIALFKQIGSFKVKYLEESLQSQLGLSGYSHTHVYYNKGM